MLRMARHVHRETGRRNLCLAGGVALNCVANGRILRETPFESLWIQPAAGDAGGALGAALLAWYEYQDQPRSAEPTDSMRGAFLGPAFADEDIRAFLDEKGIPYETCGYEALPDRVAQILEEQKVVGWFQGRMEFGPRALGARSILADPRGREVQRTVNLKIKFRESFRPFAPSVLGERAAEYFGLDVPSPYMLLVADVHDARIEGQGLDRLRHIDSAIPAVTHVDASARIQTVHEETNPLYHRLLKAWEARTGCGVLVNTSFNVRGEPIVCTPQDAYTCFSRTHMDVLVLGPYVVSKAHLPESERMEMTAEEVAAAYGLD
jgi:carbamoyltransferase